MNAANLGSLFPQSGIFQRNASLGQKLTPSPLQDTLRRLSENRLAAQEQGRERTARFDRLELAAGAPAAEGRDAFRDMPEALLHFYLNQYKVGAHLSQGQEASLTEYRDQLSAFDQTIGEYRDMLSGRAALPEEMNRAGVSRLLALTQAARERFLQDGARALNRLSEENPAQEGFLGKAYRMMAAESEDAPGWRIDASAGDIYGEIDRALAAARRMTETFRAGASRVLSELRRRGCVEAGEESSPEERDGAGNQASLFQEVYRAILSTSL